MIKQYLAGDIGIVFYAVLVCSVLGWAPAGYGENQEPHCSIAIIRTAPAYAIEIEKSLKKHLSALGYVEGRNVTLFPTIIVKDKVENFSDTARSVKEVLVKKPDIIATIGTQASVPTWQVVSKTDTPMVFSGVTYPVSGGLIEAFNQPTGKNITGISYAIPTKQRVELIRTMFPDRNAYKKIAFIYSGQVLQDFTYVKQLKTLQGVAGWEFAFID